MNNPQRPALGIRLRYILLLLWLVWLSVFVIWETTQLASLKETSVNGEGERARIEVLQNRFNELTEQQDFMQRQMATESEKSITVETLASIDQRLMALEQKAESNTEPALSIFRERLEQIESQVRQLQQSLNDRQRSAVPSVTSAAKPRIPDAPPFQLLGIELRAGVQLLSVLPKGAALAGSRLLRLGEEIDGWRLITLDAQTATFEVHGRSRTFRLPEVNGDEK